MPEMQYYEVTRTQKVNVVANSAADAVKIGDAFLDGRVTDSGETWGHVRGTAKTSELSAKRT